VYLIANAAICPNLIVVVLHKRPGRQTARLSIEKRKKGKLVTVVRGLAASDNDFPNLLTQLKNRCGAGGTIDGDLLELQGDQCEKVRKFLGELGYQVK
jgi:translation initiation factor 1